MLLKSIVTWKCTPPSPLFDQMVIVPVLVLTEEIAEKIKHLNADRTIVFSREKTSEVLKEELDAGHSVDVAIDCLGGQDMGSCLPYLTHGAR